MAPGDYTNREHDKPTLKSGYRIIDIAGLHNHADILEFILACQHRSVIRISESKVYSFINKPFRQDSGPNIDTRHGATVLALTASRGNIDSLRCLLKFPSIDINHQSAHGEYDFALLAAASKDKADTLRFLLRNGADCTLRGGRLSRTAKEVANDYKSYKAAAVFAPAFSLPSVATTILAGLYLQTFLNKEAAISVLTMTARLLIASTLEEEKESLSGKVEIFKNAIESEGGGDKMMKALI